MPPDRFCCNDASARLPRFEAPVATKTSPQQAAPPRPSQFRSDRSDRVSHGPARDCRFSRTYRRPTKGAFDNFVIPQFVISKPLRIRQIANYLIAELQV